MQYVRSVTEIKSALAEVIYRNSSELCRNIPNCNEEFVPLGHFPTERMHELKTELMVLESSLAAFDRGEINVERLCRIWHESTARLSDLPPRYLQVLDDVLTRLESSALFDEESCSFSVKDLRDSLQLWLEKARRA